ncbi:Auxin-responsive protein IAA8 [Linum grandiflorum]
MGRGGANNHPHRHSSCSSSTSSSSSTSQLQLMMRKDLSTDLRLGREDHERMYRNTSTTTTCFVKVYMEGIPIGRKLDLLAYSSYEDMIRTVDDMFATNILWEEMMEGYRGRGEQQQVTYHVLTYEDMEGDWLIVGDVPWEYVCSSFLPN